MGTLRHTKTAISLHNFNISLNKREFVCNIRVLRTLFSKCCSGVIEQLRTVALVTNWSFPQTPCSAEERLDSPVHRHLVTQMPAQCIATLRHLSQGPFNSHWRCVQLSRQTLITTSNPPLVIDLTDNLYLKSWGAHKVLVAFYSLS